MAARSAERAPPFIDPPGYARHRPEHTLLYHIIEQHYPAFREVRASEGRPLPRHVQDEFDAYLKCGRLEEGFLRVRCEQCRAEKLVAFSCKKRAFCPSCGARRMAETAALLVDEVLPRKPLRQWVLSVPFALRFLLATHPKALTEVLGIAYHTIAEHLIEKAGLTSAKAQAGAVTLIQCFGSALNLNVHLHMLVLDGVYLRGTNPARFRSVEPPTSDEIQTLLERIASRVGEKLERQGLIVRVCENAYLALDPADSVPMHDLIGHSITYRVATGPRAGQKVFTLQTLPAVEELASDERLARAAGFSLHAGVSVDGGERTKLEHLVRYVARPALAIERLALTPAGNIRYTLKNPYRDGTTAVIFEPFDFLARLAALVPLPGVNLTRYHGVFAPASALRGAVTPAGRGRSTLPEKKGVKPQPAKHASMNWMQRLKRVFCIEIETCQRCGGTLKVIASIEDRVLIDHILAHLEQRAEHEAIVPFASRGPPQPLLL